MLCKLEVFSDELAARHAAAARYDQLLGPLAGIPVVAPFTVPCWMAMYISAELISVGAAPRAFSVMESPAE